MLRGVVVVSRLASSTELDVDLDDLSGQDITDSANCQSIAPRDGGGDAIYRVSTTFWGPAEAPKPSKCA